jgi:hypothetical protein
MRTKEENRRSHMGKVGEELMNFEEKGKKKGKNGLWREGEQEGNEWFV